MNGPRLTRPSRQIPSVGWSTGPFLSRFGTRPIVLLACWLMLLVAGTLRGQTEAPFGGSATFAIEPPPATDASAMTAPAETAAPPAGTPAPTAPTAVAPAATKPPAPEPGTTVETVDPGADLTLAKINAASEAAKASADLAEPQKGQVDDFYRQAIADLTDEAQFLVRTGSLPIGPEAEEQLRTLRKELTAIPSPPVPPQVSDLSQAELEQAAETARKEVDAARTEQTRVEAEPGRRLARRAEIPTLQQAITDRLAENEKQLKAPTVETDPAVLIDARKMRLLAARRKAQAEQKLLARELESMTATADRTSVQLELAGRRAATARLAVETYTRELNARRAQEAAKLVDQARLEQSRTSPLLKDLADEAVEYAERSAAITKKLTEIVSSREKLAVELDSVNRNFQRTKEKVESVGMTEAVGLQLRQERSQLDSTRSALLANHGDRAESMRDSRFELMVLEERRAELALDSDVTAKAITTIKNGEEYRGLAPEERPSDDALSELVEEQHRQQRDNLDVLIRNQTAYFEALVELDTVERQLIDSKREFRRFIDERVLWIPSTSWSSVISLGPYLDGIRWLGDVGRWQEVAMVGWEDLTKRWWVPLAAMAVLIPLLIWQPRLRRRIAKRAEEASRSTCQSVWPTLSTMAAMTVLSAFWPMVLVFFGLRMTFAENATPFTQAVGGGLLASAGWVAWIESARQLFRPKGLAESHFFWSPTVVRQMRRIFTLLFVSVPLVFLIWMFQSQESERIQHGLGRAAFVLFMVCALTAGHRVFRAGGPWAIRMKQVGSNAIGGRFRPIWLLAFWLIPPTLIVLALVGYYFTVLQIVAGLFETLILLGLLQLAGAVTTRSLLVHRRRLAIRQARERIAAQSETNTEGRMAEGVVPPANQAPINLAQLSDQSRRLVVAALCLAGMIGLTLIWGDLLPAFNLLDTIQLWSVDTGGEKVPVTLWNIVIAGFVFAFTIIAAKNIPGMLELLVLPRLPLDAGARYAVTTIVRYGLAIAGLVLGVSMIGIEWSQYQWLVAGATVGLGFGLQEIFANFVSGLIILFERPIRVGDVVTIEGTTGVVTRIRIRATTVTNWDCQEFIVPNKEFVTGRLLNWTLSNTRNRIVINVGVAYGSDTDLARSLLIEACRETPAVLSDPPPVAVFEGFGANELKLVLRCQLATLDERLPTTNALHTLISKKFSQAGLNIPFPQQDLHIRSLPQGWHQTPPTVVEGPSRNGVNGSHAEPKTVGPT